MNELLEKVRTMLKAAPYRAYVPIVEMSREESASNVQAQLESFALEG